MARSRKRRERPGPSGFLVVDKPKGITSHDVVDAARRWFGTRRIGHLGTLDPLATGVLPLAVRDATKLIPFLPEATKHYSGTIRLGVATDTFDAEGTVIGRHDGPFPEPDTVRKVLAEFEGDILQQPPMFSSVKHGGEPLYRLARRGETVEREPRKVRIHEIAMRTYEPPDLGIDVRCTPGTYVRALADDLGQRLGCGAHLAGLRRLASGSFSIEDARTPDELDTVAEAELASVLVPPNEALGIPAVRLPRDAVGRVRNGSPVPCPPLGGPPPRPGARVMVVDDEGQGVALGEIRPDRKIHPLRVFPAAEPHS